MGAKHMRELMESRLQGSQRLGPVLPAGVMHSRRAHIIMVVAALALITTGCTGSNSNPSREEPAAPVTVLRLANGDGGTYLIPAVVRFADAVELASNGSVRVEIEQVDVGTDPGYEQSILRQTAAGSFDLAWVGTRAFSSLGVTDFEALLAPMLIDSLAVQTAVIRSDIPQRMLTGSKKAGITGLAVLADRLRTPFSIKRAYASPKDFKGATFRVFRSVEEESAARALGARITNVTGDRLRSGLKDGSVDVAETDAMSWVHNEYGPGWTLNNVVLWPRTVALVANPKRLASLSEAQNSAIRAAAKTATDFSLAYPDVESGPQLACVSGVQFAQVSPQNVAAFRAAFAPAYTELRRDPTTAKYLDEIARLKRTIKAPPSPSPCS